jgi:putative acetyltransferase
MQVHDMNFTPFAIQPAPVMLRPIRREDNAAVAAIIRGVLTEHGCTGAGFAIHDPEVDRMFETYQEPRSSFFVVEFSEKILGCGGIAPLRGGDNDTCELQKFYLLPEVRGFGHGKQLLDASLQEAKRFGFARCYLETLPFMKAATQLYEKAGFTQIDGPMGNTGHHACDRWYVKAL